MPDLHLQREKIKSYIYHYLDMLLNEIDNKHIAISFIKTDKFSYVFAKFVDSYIRTYVDIRKTHSQKFFLYKFDMTYVVKVSYFMPLYVYNM